MKFTKTEKIWLGLVLFFFIMYNLPFVPEYNHPVAALIHGACTLIPLWISVYIGLFRVSGSYEVEVSPEEEQGETQKNASAQGFDSQGSYRNTSDKNTSDKNAVVMYSKKERQAC